MSERVLRSEQLARIAAQTDTQVYRCCCLVQATGATVDESTIIASSDAVAMKYYGEALVLGGKVALSGIAYIIGVVQDEEVFYVHRSRYDNHQ